MGILKKHLSVYLVTAIISQILACAPNQVSNTSQSSESGAASRSSSYVAYLNSKDNNEAACLSAQTALGIENKSFCNSRTSPDETMAQAVFSAVEASSIPKSKKEFKELCQIALKKECPDHWAELLRFSVLSLQDTQNSSTGFALTGTEQNKETVPSTEVAFVPAIVGASSLIVFLIWMLGQGGNSGQNAAKAMQGRAFQRCIELEMVGHNNQRRASETCIKSLLSTAEQIEALKALGEWK